MMADFLHCNQCLRMASCGPPVKYYLTQCERLLCSSCVSRCVRNCLKCAGSVCQVIELNERARPDIKMCFQDMTASLKKLERVDSFQKQQRKLLVMALAADNQRLTTECNEYKLMNQNLDNELKTLRAQLEANRRAATSAPKHFQSFFDEANGGHESDMETNDSIVTDLFKGEPQNQNIFGHQLNPMNDIQMNAMNASLNQFVTPANQLKTMNASHRQPLVPNQVADSQSVIDMLNPSVVSSVRKSKISVRNYTSNESSTHSGQASRVGSERNSMSCGFPLPPTTPMTVSKPKGYTATLSSLSSGSASSSVHRMSVKSSPSTIGSPFIDMYRKHSRNKQ